MKYGYVINIQDTPADNIWQEAREIQTNFGIIYGCEGFELVGAIVIGDAADWLKFIEQHTPKDTEQI